MNVTPSVGARAPKPRGLVKSVDRSQVDLRKPHRFNKDSEKPRSALNCRESFVKRIFIREQSLGRKTRCFGASRRRAISATARLPEPIKSVRAAVTSGVGGKEN